MRVCNKCFASRQSPRSRHKLPDTGSVDTEKQDLLNSKPSEETSPSDSSAVAEASPDQSSEQLEQSNQAAITIQSIYRGHVARKLKKQYLHSVTILQAAIRGRIAYNQYQLLRKSVSILQACIKGINIRKKNLKKCEYWNAGLTQ